MKKLIIIIFFFLSSFILFSQENNIIPKKKTQKGFFQLDYMSINMKKNLGQLEENMGFSGIHYNLDFNGFYTGVGIYGSVSGLRGGLFTLGVNAGYKYTFSDNLFTDIGFHFGGGGGASALDGGGAFILPHTNLGYNFKYFSVTAGWSYINFFDGGNIESHQVNVGIQVPLSFEYASFKKRETNFDINKLKMSKWYQASNKISLLIHLNNLKVRGNSQFTNGTNIDGKTIRLAGFELNSYLNKNIFFFVKADGAYKGIPAGYMDVFIGGGYHLWMNKNRTNILTKLGIGASGGGGVDTKGGFLINPDFSLEQKLFDNLFVAANIGYTIQPSGTYRTLNYGFGLKYYVDKDGISSEEKNYTNAKLKGFQAIVKEDMYLNVSRIDNTNQNMYQISLQINFFLNKFLYGAGQTSFANFGNAGAYAEGIIGLGIQSNSFLNDKITAFAQVLGGAAGGGGISTGEGLIVKPSAGINYILSNNLNLRSAIGYVKTRGGNLNSVFVNFGVSYNFSFLSTK